MTFRHILRIRLFLIFQVASLLAVSANPPNIVILLTDDQGYGDLGCHGNPDLKTPVIDAFAAESVQFSHFYVSPVCAPTRASLMTGRYNYRTGLTDTWKGSATMHQDEVTLAEVLQQRGYATGLFGKWHLGDTYPYRPQDQGFDEVLMHRGGGIGQPSDPPGGSRYTDPILFHNGVEKQYEGYCMDVYTEAALAFMEANRERPFFIYLATNTPHTPLLVPERYAKPYLEAGLPEATSKIYGMIANIDENFARVLSGLDLLGLADNTIVIFMSDNGPKVFSPEHRHMAGMNGEKTDIYEGGIRVPFFVRWPTRFRVPTVIDTIAAHIDIMPTLLDACDITAPEGHFDGLSLLPLIESGPTGWPKRTLFLQWHRGPEPTLNRHFAAVESRFKLLQRANKFDPDAAEVFELYDLQNDPGETDNIAADHPEIVQRLQAAYERWFADVAATRGYADLPSWIGSPEENPVVLTHQDRHGSGHWGDDNFVEDRYWSIRILEAADYKIRLDLYEPAPANATARVRIGAAMYEAEVEKGAQQASLLIKRLSPQETRLSAWIESGSKKTSPRFVQMELIQLR